MTQISHTADGQNGRFSLSNGSALFGLIDRHRKIVLSSPFILAAALVIVHMLGGSEVRQVLDFMSPGHIVGR
ncbi:MAG TPA: hypothetical protein VN946_01430 [Terriglobales bacterium]|jgi:hypothetical protein|nr:hypothetical protein [Terriglobales bacterium]